MMDMYVFSVLKLAEINNTKSYFLQFYVFKLIVEKHYRPNIL